MKLIAWFPVIRLHIDHRNEIELDGIHVLPEVNELFPCAAGHPEVVEHAHIKTLSVCSVDIRLEYGIDICCAFRTLDINECQIRAFTFHLLPVYLAVMMGDIHAVDS